MTIIQRVIRYKDSWYGLLGESTSPIFSQNPTWRFQKIDIDPRTRQTSAHEADLEVVTCVGFEALQSYLETTDNYFQELLDKPQVL